MPRVFATVPNEIVFLNHGGGGGGGGVGVSL